MVVLREMVCYFPMISMISLNQITMLVVGDVVGDIHTLSIQIYDLQSATKLKVLDVSGPPSLLTLQTRNITLTCGGISTLSFPLDGEGILAFS